MSDERQADQAARNRPYGGYYQQPAKGDDST